MINVVKPSLIGGKIVVTALMRSLVSVPTYPEAVSKSTSEAMTSSYVGTEPIASETRPIYVLATSDAKQFYNRLSSLKQHGAARRRKLLQASFCQNPRLYPLKNQQLTIKALSPALSVHPAAQLGLLEKVPKNTINNRCFIQSAWVRQSGWEIYNGYAQDAQIRCCNRYPAQRSRTG